MNVRVYFFMDINAEKLESIQQALVKKEKVLESRDMKEQLGKVISEAFSSFFNQYGETKGLVEKAITNDHDGLLEELQNSNVIRPFLLTE